MGPLKLHSHLNWINLAQCPMHIFLLEARIFGYSISMVVYGNASQELILSSLLTIIHRVQDYEVLKCSIAAQHRAKYLILSPPAWCSEQG